MSPARVIGPIRGAVRSNATAGSFLVAASTAASQHVATHSLSVDVSMSTLARGRSPSTSRNRSARRNVLPEVPVRQWVLYFTRRVRFLAARHPALASRLLALFTRTVFAWQRRQARRRGLVEGVHRMSSPSRRHQCTCGAGPSSSASGEFARKAANRSEQRLDSMHGVAFSPVFVGSRR